MKKKICFIFSLFLISILSITSVHAGDFDLNNMDIDAVISEDGSIHISEKWEVEIYEGTELYKVFDNMGNSEISNFKVRDELGNIYTYIDEWDIDASFDEKVHKNGIVQDGDYYELCFGISEYGKRTYTFEYDISNFVQQYNDAQGFNYAFFSEMDVEVQSVRVELDAPVDLNAENAKIWGFGYNGTVKFVNGNVIMQTSEPVEYEGKLQLLMKFEQNFFTNASQNDQSLEKIIEDAMEGSSYSYEEYLEGKAFKYKDDSWIVLLIFGGLFAFIGIGTTILVVASNKGKKEYQFSDYIDIDKENINMFRDIPCNKDIFEFYHLAKKLGLIQEDDRSGIVAAILLRWVQQGYIDFKKEETRVLFIKSEGFSIDLNKEIEIENELELELLEFFKEAAGTNGALEKNEFEKWCSKHYASLEDWFDSIDEYVENRYRSENKLSVEVTHTEFMKIKVAHDTNTYHPSIREKMEHILGLKKFLEEMSYIHEKEVIEVKLWEEYLIFASILGIAEKVEKQLGTLCPSFNEQSRMDTIYTTRMVRTMSYTGVSAAYTASHGGGGGSSFSGGGGGFSGGGGGGSR